MTSIVKKKMSMLLRGLVAVCAVGGASAQAVEVSFDSVNTGANIYELTFDVTNNDVAAGIEELIFSFDYLSFDNIGVVAVGTGWEEFFTIPTDPLFMLDGEVDIIPSNIIDAIALGATFNDLLTVEVECITGVCNFFDGILAQGFDPLLFEATGAASVAQLNPSVNVPEPSTLFLVGAGLLGLVARRKLR